MMILSLSNMADVIDCLYYISTFLNDWVRTISNLLGEIYLACYKCIAIVSRE